MSEKAAGEGYGRIPEQGTPGEELLETMQGFAEADVDWQDGKTWALVYYPGDEHYELVKKAYNLFMSGNALNPMAFKSLKRMESEVVQMTADMLNGGPETVGTMTSGGTESILMAVKAARERASKLKTFGGKPEIVAPRTIHPAFAKAAHYFGMELKRTPLADDWRADVDALERAVSRKTVLIAASAPQYPHGMVDPIADIGSVARRHGVPFHVDACFGGFILPWLEELGYDLPVWDFRIPGVTSMSADVHKYGFAPKGASVVCYRDMSYLKHQFFVETEFPGGIYASPTAAGTRPGGAIAAAWASMRGLGRAGYKKRAKEAMETAEELREKLTSVPEIELVGSEHCTVVTFRVAPDVKQAEGVDTYAIADQLQERGWAFDRQHKPPSLHMTVNAHNAPQVDAFIEEVREAIEVVRANPELANQGEAAMYGMMAKIPVRGAVKASVKKVMESMYAPGGGAVDLENLGGDGDDDLLMGLVDRYKGDVLEVLEKFEGVKERLKGILP